MGTGVTNGEQGLTSAEAAERLTQYGENRLLRHRRRPALRILVRQFESILIWIMLFAAVIAWVVGDLVDTVAILTIVVLNAVLGFAQEWKAEQTLAALNKLVAETALVIRDGRERRIDTSEIVPGDAVILAGGDRVPADMTLAEVAELSVDESILTGESVPVAKTIAEGEDGQTFAGTAVVEGRGLGLVSATGMNTRFGHIAALTQGVEAKPTHLQRELGRLARRLGLVAVLLAVAVGLLGVAMDQDPIEMLLTSISLAVAIVPEGLPAVVTVTLALGAAAMARRKALVRRLQATETLGAASAICTDKTGTLTENKMTATRVWLASGPVDVTGRGLDPAGHFARDGKRLNLRQTPDLMALLRAGLICNTATVQREGDHWIATGSPTEAALVTLAMKGWLDADGRRFLHERPFTSDRKMMSVLVERDDGMVLYAKGAPEAILDHATHVLDAQPRPLSDADRAEIGRAIEHMGADGMRMLAVAERPASSTDDSAEDGLTLLGLVGLIDPPRAEVATAIAEAQSAGIEVVMITGDAPQTALAIAGQLGLKAHRAITREEFNAASDDEIAAALDEGVVFARTAPDQKMRIVDILQRRGKIVAMTGDGVNDAPALKQSNIGMAMGIRGTDVAKDAADIVLLDDNFATIIAAIREGRRQFANIAKFTHFLLASNAGEVIALAVNLLIGGPLIFVATQILWMNLVTDGLIALALGLEPTEDDVMTRPPRARDAGIIQRAGLWVIAGFGAYMAAASLLLFYMTLPDGDQAARTAAFNAMVTFEIASVLAFRSFGLPMFRIGFLSNRWLLIGIVVTVLIHMLAIYMPFLQQFLHTSPVGWEMWLKTLALAAPIVVVPEMYKYLVSRRQM